MKKLLLAAVTIPTVLIYFLLLKISGIDGYQLQDCEQKDCRLCKFTSCEFHP